MRIFKILNNNAVVVKEGNLEKIVLGPGIAFQKRKHDPIDPSRVEKVFVMEEEGKTFQHLLATVPEEVINLAQDIISHAERSMQVPFCDHIHIGLTDHLAFAVERVKQGQPIRNKLVNEIRMLYREEYEIGLWAIAEAKKRLGVALPEDEAAHIALHLHSAKRGAVSMQTAVRTAGMIREACHRIEEQLGLHMDRDSLSYYRFVTHLRFTLSRIENGDPFHDMDPDILAMLREKYEKAYRCAENLSRYFLETYGFTFPESEIGYLTLHIQRILEKR